MLYMHILCYRLYMYIICSMIYVICYMLYTEYHNGNQHIILPQIGLVQNKIKKLTRYRGAIVLWKPHTGKPLCFDPRFKIL